MAIASAVKRRSVQRLAGRKRPSYYESDHQDNSSDEDVNVDPEEAGPSSKRRSARQVAARDRSLLADQISDDEILRSDEEVVFEELQPSTRQRRIRVTKPKTRSATHARQSKKSPRKREKQKQPQQRGFAAPLKERAALRQRPVGFWGPSDGRIPPWASLPLEILRDIFYYAAQPMHERTVTASANKKWLMRVARTCRAFAVPALEAFYRSPALLTPVQTHFFYDLLEIPSAQTFLDYHVKVRTLEVEVDNFAHTIHGRPFHLGEFVKQLPMLQHFEILHPADTPPFRTSQPTRWTYPQDLLESLISNGTRLKTWRWSRHMLPNAELSEIYSAIMEIHQSKVCEYLNRLVVCGFDANMAMGPQAGEAGDGQVLDLAATISALPRLKDLTFISCEVVMEQFLQRIPQNLERLELCNCLEVYSDMLLAFLNSGGSQIKVLELNHNAALNLTFLRNLKMLCPRLEVLKMNLTYFSESENFNDAWTMYDSLLAPGEIPTWPSTLRHIELVRLQKLTPEVAQTLFGSLVDAARDLPNLRHLTIQAHIDIPWRDRASFRDQWIDRLERIFLRKSRPPHPMFGSHRQIKMFRENEAAHRDVDTKLPSKYSKLSHVQVASGSPAEPLRSVPQNVRRSARVSEVQSSNEDHTSVSPTEDENEMSQVEMDNEDFVQGLCDVVDIRIDNQRPTERQFTEGEFLDSEISGDEDWHEGGE